MMRRVAGPVAYGLVVAALVGLLVHAAFNPDLPQFDGKAMGARLVLFPLAALVVPVGWWIVRRRRGGSVTFPWAAAVLVVLPFVIDLVGNANRLYIRYEYFDDGVHTVNPIIGVAAIALLLDRTDAPRWSVWIMAFGLGMAAHVCFELIEYALLVGIGAVELGLTLADTLWDLAWGLVGAAIGASAALLAGRRRAVPAPRT